QTFLTVASSPLSLSFSNDAMGLVAGGAAGHAYDEGADGEIAATTDRGASWSTLRVPTSSQIDDVAFPTANVGFALDNKRGVWKTTDGGVRWSALATGASNPFWLAAPATTTVLLIGKRGVKRSTDGGKSFRPVHTNVMISTKRQRTVKLSKLVLTDARTIPSAVLAWGSRLVESTTAGRTWRSIPLPLAHRPIDNVSFVSPTTGYILQGNFRLFFTRTRGRRWREIYSTGTSNPDEQISFSSAQNGYIGPGLARATGSDFDFVDVLHTTNGGKSWQPQIISGQGGDILATPGVAYFDDTLFFSPS